MARLAGRNVFAVQIGARSRPGDSRRRERRIAFKIDHYLVSNTQCRYLI